MHDPNRLQNRLLICIGLGGICEGYLPHVLLLHATGIVRFSRILLVDGDSFEERNRNRQFFNEPRGKAEERCTTWGALYPEVPLRYLSRYVDQRNVAEIVVDDSIVLLSPDNHPTRKIVSDHAEILDNILLITGSNDAINEQRGLDGTDGQVIVHWRTDGQNRTAPMTWHHEEIARPDGRLPAELSCGEMAQVYPQLLSTNLLVGHGMVQMLMRYVLISLRTAVAIVELGVNSREGTMVPYGIHERPLVPNVTLSQ